MRTQIFLIMILAFQRSIICAYEQVQMYLETWILTVILAFQRSIICAYEQEPRDMDVFCVCTQIFLIMILAFQRWIICAYEQVPRDMDVFCVRTQIFLKMLFDLPKLDHLHVSFKIWRIYQRTKSNNGAQTSTYL